MTDLSPENQTVCILALDLATRTGACFGASGSEIQSAWVDFAYRIKKPAHGQLYVACHEFVEAMIDRSNPGVVFVEEQTYRGKGSRLLHGFKAVVQLLCAQRGIRFVGDLNACQARQIALGSGGLDKETAIRTAMTLYTLSSDLREDEVDARILHEAAQVWLRREALLASTKKPRKPKTTSPRKKAA